MSKVEDIVFTLSSVLMLTTILITTEATEIFPGIKTVLFVCLTISSISYLILRKIRKEEDK